MGRARSPGDGWSWGLSGERGANHDGPAHKIGQKRSGRELGDLEGFSAGGRVGAYFMVEAIAKRRRWERGKRRGEEGVGYPRVGQSGFKMDRGASLEFRVDLGMA